MKGKTFNGKRHTGNPHIWFDDVAQLMLTVSTTIILGLKVMAATETIDGYTWTYRLNGETAEICNSSESAAVSPSPAGNLTIPDTLGGKPVTIVGDHAFLDCQELTNVAIPSSVTSIGANAFRSCLNLSTITVPSSVNSIGHLAFHHCEGLTSVTISEGVKSIGNGAFDHCIRLRQVTIPESVDSLGDNVFLGCNNLRNVKMPKRFKMPKLFPRPEAKEVRVPACGKDLRIPAPEGFWTLEDDNPVVKFLKLEADVDTKNKTIRMWTRTESGLWDDIQCASVK